MLQKRVVCWEFTTFANGAGTMIRANDVGLSVISDDRKSLPDLLQVLRSRNIAHLEKKFGARAKRSAVQINGNTIQLMMFTA